jgi:hypothetical protein
MSCSPFDLRDYYFKELANHDHRQMEAHVKTCARCREELDRLRGTEAALLTLPDEEIPQRIGFVSDPVFRPVALQRWWAALWESAPRLGFASAAMLSIALVVFALHRPVPPIGSPAPAPDRAALEAEFTRRVNEAVHQAVAESEARLARQTQALLAASEKRHELETQDLKIRVEDYINVERKRRNTQFLASADTGSNGGGQ